MTERVRCHCERRDVGLTLVDENFTVILRSCKDRRISDEFVKIDTSASPQYDDVLAGTGLPRRLAPRSDIKGLLSLRTK